MNDSSNPCGYCKVKDSVLLYSTYDIFSNAYTIHRCNGCHAYFLAPYPTAEQLERAYADDYYGEGEEKFEGLIEKILDYFRRKRAGVIAKHLGGKGRVLDIGCGNGKFLRFVQAQGDFDINGVEMEGGSARRAAQIPGINLKVGVLERGDFEPESVDAITLFHVFEHLTEPIEYLEIIRDIVRPGGILMMSFPNIDSFQAKAFKGDWLHLDPPRHLFFFSPTDFKRIMSEYGFEVIRERHFSLEYNPFGMAQSLLNKALNKREVLYESLKGNKAYTKEYSSLNLKLQDLFFKLSSPLFIGLDLIDSLFRKGATVEFVLRKKGG